MADYTQTVAESLNLLGPQDTSKWGTMIWGVGTWGSSIEDYRQDIGKGWPMSISLAEALSHREVVKYLPTDTVTGTDVISKSIGITLNTDSLVLTDDCIKSMIRSINLGTIGSIFDNTDLYLKLGMYYHQFISEVDDADDRSQETYTQSTHASDTYTQSTNPSTPWS